MKHSNSSASVIMLGAGAHAKVVLEILENSNLSVYKVIDPTLYQQSTNKLWRNYELLEEDSALEEEQYTNCQVVIGFASLKPGTHRKRVFELWHGQGKKFPLVRHRTATISPSARIGSGVQLLAGSILQADSEIGNNVLINSGAIVEHDSIIGNHTHLAPRSVLCGGVTVGSDSHIGAGATVIQGISIGSNCMIAAGAVVTRDVEDGAWVKGVPARPFLS